MRRRRYAVRFKRSPQGRKVYTWAQFHESETAARESVQAAFAREAGMKRAVIVAVEDQGPAHPLQD